MTQLFAEPLPIRELGIEDFKSTTGEVLGATFDKAWDSNVTPLMVRAGNRHITNTPTLSEPGIDEMGVPTTREVPNPYFIDSPLLDPEEANKRFGVTHGGKQVLGWTEPVREREAQELQGLKRDELRREDIINRGAGGFWQGAAKLTVGLGASVIDPLNIASAFVPVVGQARYATMLVNAGSGMLARAGVRAGVGALEGAVGAAMLEPIVYGLSKAEQADYTMADSLMAVAFGSVLGGGLHMGAGAVKDRISGIPKIIDSAPPSVRDAMFADALTATLEGRPVRADLALREHLLGGTSASTPLDLVRSRFDSQMGPFGPREQVGVDLGGGPRIVETPHPMPDRGTGSIPVIARNGELASFTTLKRAENAVNRIERDEGYRPEIVETPEGYLLQRETKVEPVHARDGTVMTFENQRQAERYRDQILKDENLDAMPVSDGGPVRYALVAGASQKELTAARRAPDQVKLPVSRDVETRLQQEARDFEQARRDYEREYTSWLEEKKNPTVRASQSDLRVLADYNEKWKATKETMDLIERPGGRTENTEIARDIAELQKQIDAIEAVGEFPGDITAFKKELADMDARSKAETDLLTRVAGCLAGTV